MTRPVPNRAYERQPRHFGAAPHQYRYGTAVGLGKSPSRWEPETQHDPHYPHDADQYGQDVKEWRAAIEVFEHRRGPLVILALVDAARRPFGKTEIAERQRGVDIPDDNGNFVHVSAVDFIIEVLKAHLPVHEEAMMLRIGFKYPM